MRPAPRLSIGDPALSRTLDPLTITDIVRFAGAGGDFNPLHHDAATARAAGFDSVIAMGQYQAGVVAAVLSDWVGVENVRRYEVRFVSPLELGDSLTVSGRVVADSGGMAQLELSGSVGDRVVITATASVIAR